MKNLLTFILLAISLSSFCQTITVDTTFAQVGRTFIVRRQCVDEKYIILSIYDNKALILKDTLDFIGPGGGFDLWDFDMDGNKDLLLTMIGNNPISFLYLFDITKNSFKNVEGFNDFPQANAVKGQKNIYYSYHRSGCADANWVSDLFKIVNFETIQIGHIYGKGCDFEVGENPPVIEIYKILDNDEEKEELIQKIPYSKGVEEYGDKWDFIENYWSNNYKRFE